MDSISQSKFGQDGGDRSRARRNLRILYSCSAAALLASVATEALAQEPTARPAGARESVLGEVIVTARRREENIQEVPAAITAISDADLEEKQITTHADLRYIAPSLSVQGRFGHQGGTYSIRGLAGTTNGSATVGTYFAEVPSAQGVAGFDVSGGTTLYDLQSVQVLKGPQGTLFGRTATAGAVLVTPRKPNMNEFEGRGELTVGSLGRTEVMLALGVPIVPGVLAARFAVHDNHVDGYTRAIGTDFRFDETDTRAYRATFEFTPTDWFRNSTILDYYKSDAAPGGMITVAANPALPILNLPANTPAFNAVCAVSVAQGLSASVPACVAQRLSILSQLRSQLIAEAARTSAGGGALRRSAATIPSPYREISKREILVNTTTVTLPSLGAFEWQFKNIFGYQRISGYSLLPLGSTPSPTLIAYSGAPNGSVGNQVGNQIVPSVGDGFEFYTDEAQLSGSFDDDRLVWVAGYFYQRAPLGGDSAGLPALSRTLGGVATYNLGFAASGTYPIGGRSTEEAYYGQATLNFDGLIDGLNLTAGYRHSKNKVRSIVAPAVVNPATGVYSPSATVSQSFTESSGNTYNFSIDYKVTPSIMIYATHRKGYIPGGVNTQAPGASSVPNYQPTYGPEIVKDYEVGAKIDFDLSGMGGRLNLAYYDQKYNGIQRNFSGILPSTQTIIFIANVAKAKLSGFEAELQLQVNERARLGFDYSYNKTKYTSWQGSDPFNLAPVGTNIDLSFNPFPNAPKHKVSVNASYDVVQSDSIGTITLRGQAYAQSREWYSAFGGSFVQVYGQQVKEAVSQKSYAIFNAKVEWTDVMGHEGLGASLFVRNLTDKIYTASGLTMLSTAGPALKLFSPPRTYGVSLTYDF